MAVIHGVDEVGEGTAIRHTGGAMHVSDPVFISSRTQASFSITAAAAGQSNPLEAGIYDVWCTDGDVYIKVGTTADDVTASTGYIVKQNNVVPVAVSANQRIGAILAPGGGSGTLRFHRTR